MPNFIRSLGFRLFSLLLLIGIIVFLSLTVFIIKSNTHYLMNEIVNGAKRANDLIEGSIHYSMLQNRKEDVAQIIRTLGNGPGVEGIRIYNKKGLIVFSTNDKELGQAADLTAEQCVVCHGSERPLEYIPDATRPRIFNSPQGYRVLAVINPIRNEPACAVPGCHLPPNEQKILGVLDAKMSLAEVDRSIQNSRNRMILYSIGAIFMIELFAGLFIWRMVHRRVADLSEGTRKVMNGNLDFSLNDSGNDEIAGLAKSFNSMVKDLNQAEEKNKELSQTMVHVAKMASMGKLAATVAHEINNPLGGILTYTKLLNKQISSGPLTDEERKLCSEQLDIVVNEIKRCGNIVKNMLHFSKSSDSQFDRVNLHELIEKSLFIIAHHLEINEIAKKIRLESKDPNLVGNADQLHQMLICLFVNAVEAMSPPGRGGALTIVTEDVPQIDAIRLRVEDNGKGIPKEMQSSIFEPFFTTKEETHGVGLGLSVVYGIVMGHGGSIEVDSEPGRGTAFIITLPRKSGAAETSGSTTP